MDRISDEDILVWLESDEARSRPYRVERMQFLLDLFGQEAYMQFYGGVVPAHAFEELRLAYLNGLYISTVVVSQIVVEHILAGIFDLVGRTDMQGVGFQKLTEQALVDGYISEQEHSDLNRLRQLRNPYSHSKPMMHETCFMRRAAETDNHHVELFKQDAEAALTIIARILSRQPFSFESEPPDAE